MFEIRIQHSKAAQTCVRRQKPGHCFPNEGRQEPVTAKGQTHAVGILPGAWHSNMVRENKYGQPAGCWMTKFNRPVSICASAKSPIVFAPAFYPAKKGTVADKLAARAYHKIDLSQGAVLETGCVYLVPLMEAVSLPERTTGFANPKSSTGRIDVFTRLITDFGTEFDKVPARL